MASGEEEVALFLKSMDKVASHLEFLRKHNGAISPESDLATDDQLWTHHPVSQVVWQAMVSAADHLDLMKVIAMRAPEKTFVTAAFTVAVALWSQVLKPCGCSDRTKRISVSSGDYRSPSSTWDCPESG